MLQWFKKHPEFLRQESTALSNDSNYKELHQYRDNLFISNGNIIVRLNNVHRFPIIIIYTDGTPYRLPLIFPLQSVLSNQEIEELASLSLNEAIERIKPFIQFYYQLRHQNSSGELCILELDNLDEGSHFYGIGSILQRIRNWFAGHLTNVFPTDSEEVDFCSHFNFISKEFNILYPEHFFNDQLIEGDCYATLYNYFPEGRFFKNPRYIYVGAFLDGIGKNGLINEVQVNLERLLNHEKLKTSIDLFQNSELVKQLIDQKKLLKASWFQINQEPSPFHKLSDLINIIGNGNFDEGVKRLTERLGDTFRQLPESFFLGIRFPNRKGINEFQLFRIHQKETPTTIILHADAEEKMRSILERYEKVEAIAGEKFTETTFHQRNSKRADYNILKNASVNIFGVGAIGSEIADCIAKAGAGNLTLFDTQTLSANNSVRHLAGLESIGLPKVIAVAEILFHHNPFIKIGYNTLNLFTLEASQHLDSNSITISSIADDNVEGFINQQLVIDNKTAFYVRALRGGKAARIFRVIPGKDACFNCLSLYRKEKKGFVEIPDDPDYPTLKNECNNPIRPASAADLKFIAAFASNLFIDQIQNGDAEQNHWIWSSEVIEGTPITTPYQFFNQFLPPHDNCTYCNNELRVDVFINKESLLFMQELISKNPLVEIGGVLAGWVDEAGNINITDVSGPGPKAIQSATKFEKDVDFCQQFLDDLYIKKNQTIIYVGEWHSHPSTNNYPSGTDIKSLSEIALQKNYLTECPVMIIFSNTGEPSCTIHPAGKTFYHSKLKIIK